MSDATDRLRERMQNEQTSLALSELLRNNRAELITLRAENAALRKSADDFKEIYHQLYMVLLNGGSDPYLGALEQAAAIIAERDALRADAKRWQIFQSPDFSFSGPVNTDGEWNGYTVFLKGKKAGRGDTLQAAIDAARRTT